VSEAAAHYGASWPIVHAAFAEHVRLPLAAPLPPVKVLGIDETRRGKPIWAQDPHTKRWVLVCDRWHTGFVDAAGTGGLLAQVEGRTSAATIAWLNAQPAPWRAGITHVTIDLSASYAKAVRVALPSAVLVADRYHLVALANGMLTQVRQRIIRETHDRRGRKTDPAWAARRRLLTRCERLRPETFAKMWNSLIDTSDEGVQILQAYVVQEELRAVLALAGTNPERHVIRTRLESFYQHAAATDAPEAHRLAATIEAWWPAIEAGIQVPAASTNPVCHRSQASTHRCVSGSWAKTGLPRRVSSIPSTFTGGRGAARGTWTCSTNALCTMDQSTPKWAADSDTTRPCSAIAYPSSVRSRVVSLERARTAGSDSVNEARWQSRSLQRHRRLCQITRNTLVP
jgi:transposase